MLINGERALAYIVTIDEVRPLDGYDRVEYARTNGWWVVISKNDNLHVGDKCVYFEIDSLVPETDQRFEFLAAKHYKIKTQKMCKVYSQGLLMPLDRFPELGDAEVGTDVTSQLGVTYSTKEDNERKRKIGVKDQYKSMAARHPELFKKRSIRWLMKREWGRRLLYVFFGKKRANALAFPSFVKKTDEERIENVPWRINDGMIYVLTEKADGSSGTYVLQRKPFHRFEFYVCSRNVRQLNENQKTYHDHNIYWDMAFKYDIKKHLRDYLDEHKDVEWVCIQGECVGSVQGNPLKLSEDDLYVFNFITSKEGRFGSYEGKEIIEKWGMKWVPILGTDYLSGTMEEVKANADGKSAINSNVMREGIVYRSLDGQISFKNVSRKYLLKASD